MKKKILLIVIPIILISALVIYLGFISNKNKYSSFVMEGYILTSSNDNYNETSKYYFNSGAKYEKKYLDKVLFEDVEGNKVTISNESFIHYVDGSASILKKSVIMDFKEINSSIIKYYNMFEKTVLKKVSNGYSIENGGNTLQLNDFIVKISDNKYLIISDDIKIRLDNGEEAELKDYIEVTFFDGNVTRIENQQVTYKTISSLSYIKIDDSIVIKTNNQGVYVNDERKMSLSQMVIDSNDNIDIIPDEEKEEPDNEDEESGGRTDNNQEGGTSGQEQLVNEDDNILLPVFNINYMDVTSNKIDANISIVDEDNLLSGLIKVKIYENSNWKTVYYVEDSTGLFELNVLVENLRPETSYTLVVESSYSILDIVYEKEFISKSFRTESLGIALDKYYYTKTALNYKVRLDDYSDVKGLNVKIYDSKKNLLETVSVDTQYMQDNELKDMEINFNSLTHDTQYTVEMGDILYNNSIISAYYSTTLNAKTLKEKPTFGELSHETNKMGSSFTLKANNVSDTDHGITNYRYEIYDARTLSENSVDPVIAYEKNTLTPVEAMVDDTSLYRGVPYVFKLVTTFFDNEKVYEYESGYSSVFKMEGVNFPKIRFEKDIVTFERIKGIIYLEDTGNTISLNSDDTITIVYTNKSVGVVKSYTTTGNLTIPIDINNLRANETYIISVYATVDLQDGNEAIDKCFIGSIIVDTEPTKPFVASLANLPSSSSAFNVRGILGHEAGVDNTLEASTLTGITFSLYTGQNTSSVPIRSEKIDRDLREYNSELKTLYYDNSFDLTPSFFGLTNSDLTSEYYTIRIENAYDYTEYENNIPIINSSIVVKVIGTPPEVPTSEERAMEINVIKNKDAGDKYDSMLGAETIVGYRIRANYDNSRKYAKSFTYHVHNAKTGDIITDYDTVVLPNNQGQLQYVEFYLKNGLSYDDTTVDFVRGEEYYFSYQAMLDLDGDGTAETNYPSDILEDGRLSISSKIVSADKQAPTILMYPSLSTSDSFVWKYKINDVDRAIYTNQFNYKIDSGTTKSVEVETNSDVYKSTTLIGLSKGYLNLSIRQALINKSDAINDINLLYQYFDGEYTLPDLTYSVVLQSNRLLISIVDYENKIDIINKIASLKLIFTSEDNKQIILDNQILSGGNLTVDLERISSFINKQISLEIVANYDSGIEGYDITNEIVALKSILNASGGGQYFIINRSLNLYPYDSASGSVFNRTFSPNNNSLYLKNLITNYEKTIPITLSQGVSYNHEYVTLKELKSSALIGNGTQNFKFDIIIPGVSLLDANGKQNIAAGLEDVEVLVKLYGTSVSQIRDQLLYVDVYETDKTGMTSELHSQVTVDIETLEDSFKIEGLMPKTYYYLELSVYLNDGENYTKQRLYDIDSQSSNKLYYFTTLDNIGITNAKATFKAESYANKYIAISYNIDRFVGYDRIEYEVYRHVIRNGVLTKELVDIDISDDIMFTELMTKRISTNPGGPFVFGSNYDIVIKPYTTVEISGETRDIELLNHVITYNLKELLNPFVGVSSVTTNNTTEIKVSVYDINKVIVNGTYTITILDKNSIDVTPDVYKNVSFSISTLNKIFSIEGLEGSSKYNFVVLMVTDKKNDMETTDIFSSSHNISTPSQTGILIGDVYATTNREDITKIDLSFYNSAKINEIEELRYSIYNSSGYVIDNQINFIPQQYESTDGVYYRVTLPEEIRESGVYHIEMQFLIDGEIVGSTYVQYNL